MQKIYSKILMPSWLFLLGPFHLEEHRLLDPSDLANQLSNRLVEDLIILITINNTTDLNWKDRKENKEPKF